MWVAYVSGGQVLVRSAAGTSSPWSAPFLLAHGLAHDDIAALTARSGRVGVFWSNQKTGLFGYREHRDGASLTAWTRDETPGARDAKKGGHGFADDHMKLVATPGGTLYVAAKTSYDSSARPRLILLVRRPNGRWDDPYAIDSRGTRPTIAVSANSRTLVYAYRESDGGGPIQFRLLEDRGSGISIGDEQSLITGRGAASPEVFNDVSTVRTPFQESVMFIASGSSLLGTAEVSLG